MEIEHNAAPAQTDAPQESTIQETTIQAAPQQAAPTQEKAESQIATFDMLVKKPRRVAVAEVSVANELGDPVKLQVKFQGLSSAEYDALVAKHPPSKKDKENNGAWNSKTFPPALVAECSLAPKLTEAQARELSEHPDWASGEFTELFLTANRATMGGLSIPFNENG